MLPIFKLKNEKLQFSVLDNFQNMLVLNYFWNAHNNIVSYRVGITCCISVIYTFYALMLYNAFIKHLQTQIYCKVNNLFGYNIYIK